MSSQGTSPLQTPHATEDADIAELEPLSEFLSSEPASEPIPEEKVVPPTEIIVTNTEATEVLEILDTTVISDAVESKQAIVSEVRILN